jgi:hypothetical protein
MGVADGSIIAIIMTAHIMNIAIMLPMDQAGLMGIINFASG